MKRRFKAIVFCIGFAIPWLPVPVLAAEQPKQAPPAPVPAQILAAKRVFVANAGLDQTYPDPLFTGGPDRAYNNFYAAMKAWGRYELVGAPSSADLLFEIGLTVRTGGITQGPALYSDARFRLMIRDPKTNAALWALTEEVEPALLQGNHDKNFDHALARIVSGVQRLAAPSTAPAGEPNRP